jgi:hypothetical protein
MSDFPKWIDHAEGALRLPVGEGRDTPTDPADVADVGVGTLLGTTAPARSMRLRDLSSGAVAAHHALPDAQVGGYTRALLGATFFVGAVIVVGLRAANTKGEPPGTPHVIG